MSNLNEREESIRVIVVDDHPLFRNGVVSTIQDQSDMEVADSAATARDAVLLATNLLPDVILLDIEIPGGGLSAAASISASCPVTKIIMLTVSEDEEDVIAAFRGGAQAYVLKGVSAAELTDIIRSINRGEVYVTPTLASRVLQEMSSGGGKSESRDPLDVLTDRERQILERVASGDSNKEVAYEIGISEKTVKHYMTNIMQKLHARNRVEAALLAHDAGLGALQREDRNDG